MDICWNNLISVATGGFCIYMNIIYRLCYTWGYSTYNVFNVTVLFVDDPRFSNKFKEIGNIYKTIDTIFIVGNLFTLWIRKDLEPLDDVGKEVEDFKPCQLLTKTRSASDSKRDHFFRKNELPVFVDMTINVELARILPGIWIVVHSPGVCYHLMQNSLTWHDMFNTGYESMLHLPLYF